MQQKILFCQIVGGWWETRVVFLWKFSLNVIQIWVCVKAQWERLSVHTSRSHYVYLKPIFFSVYYCIISYFFNMPERIYTEYGKDLLQILGWYVCQGVGESPWGLLTSQAQGQSHNPRQWGTSLFTFLHKNPWLGSVNRPLNCPSLDHWLGRVQAIL